MSNPAIKNILRPSVAVLQSRGRLLLDSQDMADFLNAPRKVM
jgi:hypothetical protein